MRFLLAPATAALVLAASVVQAATTSTTSTTSTTATHPHRSPLFSPFSPFGLNGGYGGGGDYLMGDIATNAYQGIDYGIAKILHAQGDSDLAESQAALNATEVYNRQMDNWKKSVVTYFDVQRVNREARAAERGRPLTETDYTRMAQMGKPRRLTPSEVEVVRGDITWPRVLMADDFAPERDAIAQSFSDRAYYGAMDLDAFLRVRRTAQSMLETLRSQIADLPPTEYMTARRFLESLAYEAQFPSGSMTVSTAAAPKRTDSFSPVR